MSFQKLFNGVRKLTDAQRRVQFRDAAIKAAVGSFSSSWTGAFAESCVKRYEAGGAEYGDGSFYRPTVELVDEIAEEAQDVVVWAGVLYEALHRVRSHCEAFSDFESLALSHDLCEIENIRFRKQLREYETKIASLGGEIAELRFKVGN